MLAIIFLVLAAAFVMLGFGFVVNQWVRDTFEARTGRGEPMIAAVCPGGGGADSRRGVRGPIGTEVEG